MTLMTTDTSWAQSARSGRPWHAVPAATVAEELTVTPATGLSDAEAAERSAVHGPNSLPPPRRRARVMLLVDQVRNPLIVLLLGAAVIASLIGDRKDAAVIVAVVVINSVLGFLQEFRAEKSLESLREMLVPACVVRRNGQVSEILAVDLVPGDIVTLEAGSQVPADGRLLVAEQLEIDESALTGESLPTSKRTDVVAEHDAPLGDRWCMAFMNTTVTRGRGELVVTATGALTEMGLLSDLINRTPLKASPLQQQLAALATRLTAIGALAVAAYLAIGLLSGAAWDVVVLAAVALAVAAVPEGLPVVVTITLAVGARHMARRGALVKNLASVETLGATSVVCTDKTGTLTLNQMTVRDVKIGARAYHVAGEGYQRHGRITGDSPTAGATVDEPETRSLQRLARAVVLCNDSSLDDESAVGDPMEAALLVLATKVDVEPERVRAEVPRLAELPFDAHNRYMATAHVDPQDPTRALLMVKGAVDALLPRCDTMVEHDGRTVVLDDETRAAMSAAMTELAGRGLRVLAVAERPLPLEPVRHGPVAELVEELTLLGLVGLLDPPRAGVVEAIAACHDAGVDVKMITGDHAATAEAIAHELGITGRTSTGIELDGTDDDRDLLDVGVFARVSPEHKLRIVGALRGAGHVTAMTGDGVNDAPALRAADIGVAMGKTGTQVSRDAAAMVLVDDHFATIVNAVEAGRAIYANIVSFLRFQLTTSAGAIMTMLAASLIGLPAPLTAVQILWINMIMDGPPAIALGLDSPERDVMQRPPRAAGGHLLPLSRTAVIALNGAIMATGTLLVLAYGTQALATDTAVTLTFTTFVLFQVVSALTVRSPRLSVFHLRTLTNRALWTALAVVVALQVLTVQVPFAQAIFDTVALTPGQWLIAAGTASSLLVVDEARKLAIRRLWPLTTETDCSSRLDIHDHQEDS